MKSVEGWNEGMVNFEKNTTIATVSVILLIVFVGILIQVNWL